MKCKALVICARGAILFGVLTVCLAPFTEVYASSAPYSPQTSVSIHDGRWHLNGQVTYPGTRAEGLLMNVRMVNSTFEDPGRSEFDAERNTDEFIAAIADYTACGVRAFTLCLQGGFPGYEGAVNSAFNADGSLRPGYMQRVKRVIEACDRQGVVVILGCYYQRQDQILKDAAAVRAGVVNVVKWIEESGFGNVVLEIANEFAHGGFDHRILKTAEGQAELIRLAKETYPALLVSTSGLGNGRLPDAVAEASDFLLIHFNDTRLADIPARIAALRSFGKPIVCNEDDKVGEEAAKAVQLCAANGASWGFMHVKVNQYYPFTFGGPADDPAVYAMIRRLTSESAGGRRQVAVFRVERFAKNPIIYPGMPGLKAERGQENINGPSLIRVPDWVENALGRYYLYFAHHNGTYIRLAYSNSLEGPWTIHEGGVLPMQDAPGRGHIASPDVHVDHERRRMRMYYHQPAPAGSALSGQLTWAAVSEDGLQWKAGDEVLGLFYFRVFEHGDYHYALAKYHNDGGILYRARDGLTGFETGPRVLPRVRHTAVWHDKKNDVLYVFYSRGLDEPEHLMVSRVENPGDPWDRWEFSEPVSIMRPEYEWEGANEPQKRSGWGAARGRVHELRDPAVYEEEGRLYLLYSVAGEQGIAIARLHVSWRPMDGGDSNGTVGQ